ncbi:MAG: chromosomal replication initiator protein DnaA [Acholeplasmataceae bacterium]|jgi:chromosomal replication initiator protein|nr:chromosomal replication initiator protein DnaA [Acholeplasmataceae bacterium]
MDTSLNLWKKTLEVLKKEMDEQDFAALFSEVSEIYKVEGNYIYLLVPNALTKFRIEKFYNNRLNEILSTLTDSLVKFKFVLKDDILEREESSQAKKKSLYKRPLKAEYTFSNFVTGGSNRFAFISAMKVAESPESLYNPLYIFGDVGLGKTHLMMAIGHYILDNKIDANVVYTSAQEFTEDYFLAISTKKGKENIEEFYRKYREADILLVDDIQFLEGKQSTQEEFFKVFEYLHGLNKQIVITSDRSANDLKNMMARLKSRFNWGLAVDIKPPDKELRVKILERKLSFLIKNPKEVPLEVLDLIADIFTKNVRDLEGGLRRYVTYCVSLNLPFTIENVYTALDCLIPQKEEEKHLNVKNFESVKKEVASYFKISVADLESPSRKQQIAYPRQMAMYLIKELYGPSLKAIGELFGNRDHATVSHSCDKISNLINSNPLVKGDYDLLMKKINS